METNDFITSGILLKKLVEKKVEPVMEEYNLRPVELDILVLLYREKEIDTAKAIVQKKHFSKAHISKSIDNLNERGFIEVAEDMNDRRILHIQLAEKSEEVVKRMLAVYGECKKIIEKEVSREDLETVKKVVRQMNENISRELGED